jgi:thiol:disulfide interchange protein DsbG
MIGKFATLLLVMGIMPAFAQVRGAAPLQLIDKNQPAQKAAPAKPEMPPSAAGFDQSVLIQRYGNIVDRRPLGAGGLTAWTVEKNGRRVVLYTTADGQAIISGIVWESMSGRNLSDQFIPNNLPNVKAPLGGSGAAAPQAAASATEGAALVGKYSGAIPESIKTIDTLAGIKEGKGGQADTLYVIVDPRCPYCRKAYNLTREYVKRGFTIKWIPAVVLGNPQQGNALAATILQATPQQQADALRRVLGNKEEIATEPTKATIEALDRNAAFFFAAFQNNGVEQAGVPVAFFLDKRTGKPRMMTGISELPVIEEVFGKL